MLNEIWRLELCPMTPSAHPESQKAAMNIYVDEQADIGILSDEQDWLTLNLKQLLLSSPIFYSSKSKRHQTILSNWKLSIKDYTSNAQHTTLHMEQQNKNHESNYPPKTVLPDPLHRSEAQSSFAVTAKTQQSHLERNTEFEGRLFSLPFVSLPKKKVL